LTMSTSSDCKVDKDLQQLRDFVASYLPGQSFSDKKNKKFPPTMMIGLFGPRGHGKSALVNTLWSSFKNIEPLNISPVQSVGKHGTVSSIDFELSSGIKLCDFRGADFVDKNEEMSELKARMSGKMKSGEKMVRRNDFEWNSLTPFMNFVSRLTTKELKIHMVLLVISLQDYDFEPIQFQEMVDVILNSFKMKPLIVLTHKDTVAEERVKEIRELLSSKLKFDINHIVALENYHFDGDSDPLVGFARVLEIEKRSLKLLKIALQLGDEQLKLTS